MNQRRDEDLSESVILKELEQYAELKRAYQAGKRGAELPKVSSGEPVPRLWAVGSLLFHPVLALLTAIARPTGAQWLVALLARARIACDRLSYEPRSCGLNNAYTNLGRARLGQGDVAGAIQCLDASWRVHPCPHNCSFGLKQRLAAELKPYPEAHASLEQYERMSQRFLLP